MRQVDAIKREGAGSLQRIGTSRNDRHRWVAHELLYHHPAGFSALGIEEVERLARGMDSWGAVDAFGRYISGPAGRKGFVPDATDRGWAISPSRWWRGAALVSTAGLNLRAAGGTGAPSVRSISAVDPSRVAMTWLSRPCRGHFERWLFGTLTPCAHSLRRTGMPWPLG